jgi:hypothetical protein
MLIEVCVPTKVVFTSLPLRVVRVLSVLMRNSRDVG